MHASRRLTNQAWAAQNITSYAYLFNVLVNGMPNTSGSTHFQEVAFMLDNTNGLGYPQNNLPNPFGGKPQSYLELARLMTRMWASFIYSGDPNNSGGEFFFFLNLLLLFIQAAQKRSTDKAISLNVRSLLT
jgi:triacylglycerol lipase